MKLYSTGESAAGIQLNMLHKKCGSRLRQQYFCPVDNEVVGRDDIVKGYEYSKGQYVLFTEEELKALNPEPTNAVEITEFVPLEQVDPVYYEKSYYLGPDKGGDRPYRLLAEAMKQTGRAALARYAARGKDQFVLLRPYESGPRHAAAPLRRRAALLLGGAGGPRGGQGAGAPARHPAHRADRRRTSSTPRQYEDKQRQQVRALIERKVQGEEITAAPVEAPKAQIIDLMAALKASLAGLPPEPPAAEPVSLADRKPARRSPRSAGEAAPAAEAPREEELEELSGPGYTERR